MLCKSQVLYVIQEVPKSAYATNELSSIAFRYNGAGHTALCKFAEVFIMPKPGGWNYVQQDDMNATKAAQEEVQQSIAAAATTLRTDDAVA